MDKTATTSAALCAFRLILAITVALLLSACSDDSPQAMLENYSNRISNALDQPAQLELSPPSNLPAFPRRRDRFQPVEDVRQGLIEVFNLRHCRLITLVAERNSSLGKVMAPSKQLAYELELYVGLRDCLRQLIKAEAEADLISQISDILVVKQRNLPMVLWNGIYTSEAFERNFSRAEPPLPLQDTDSFISDSVALQTLIKLAALQNDTSDWAVPAELETLENHYQALYNNRFGSRWLHSVSLLSETLNHTADVIEQRLQRRPLCFNGRSNPKATIVKNVFTKYYAGELQPYMARVDQQGRRWLALNNRLLSQFSRVPTAMQRYQQQALSLEDSDSVWQQYIQARNRHTKSWQTLLGQCGLMPKRGES